MGKKKSLYNNYDISKDNGKTKACCIPELDKVIIGIPMDFDLDSEDVSVLLESQVYGILFSNGKDFYYPNYYSRLFALPPERRAAVEDGVNNLINNGNYKIHCGLNCDAVLSYCYHLNKGLYLATLIKQLFGTLTQEEITSMTNTIKKMVKSASFHDESRLLSGFICAYNMITPSFCKDGKGYVYKMTETMSYEDIEKFDTAYIKSLRESYFKGCEKLNSKEKINVDEIFNIEDIFDNKLNLKGKYVKLEIQTMYKYIYFDKTFSQMIEAMLNG